MKSLKFNYYKINQRSKKENRDIDLTIKRRTIKFHTTMNYPIQLLIFATFAIGLVGTAPSGGASPQSGHNGPTINDPITSRDTSRSDTSSDGNQQPLQHQVIPTLPNVNLFMDRQETRRLIGLDNQPIYYVQNGVINNYALGFTIPVSYEQTDLHFTWSNDGPTNVSYAISLVISNLAAVAPPTINITRNGNIPRDEQVFRLSLPCSQKITADVEVQILINITGLVPVIGSAATHDNTDIMADTSDGANVDTGGNNGQLMGDDSSSSAAEDQWPRVGGANVAYKQVWQLLRIKRNKICYMHPVHVAPSSRPSTFSTRPITFAANNNEADDGQLPDPAAPDGSVVDGSDTPSNAPDDANANDATGIASSTAAAPPSINGAPNNSRAETSTPDQPTTGTHHHQRQHHQTDQAHIKSPAPPKPISGPSGPATVVHPINNNGFSSNNNNNNINNFDSNGDSISRVPSTPSLYVNWAAPSMRPRPSYDDTMLENNRLNGAASSISMTTANGSYNGGAGARHAAIPLAIIFILLLLGVAIVMALLMIRSPKFPHIFNSVTGFLIADSRVHGHHGARHQPGAVDANGAIKISASSSAASSTSSTSAMSGISGKSVFARSPSSLSSSYYTHKNCGYYGSTAAQSHYQQPPPTTTITADLLTGTTNTYCQINTPNQYSAYSQQQQQQQQHIFGYPQSHQQPQSNAFMAQHPTLQHHNSNTNNNNNTTTLIWSSQDTAYMPLTLAPPPPSTVGDNTSVYQTIY